MTVPRMADARCNAWDDLYGLCELTFGHPGPHARVPGGATRRVEWHDDRRPCPSYVVIAGAGVGCKLDDGHAGAHVVDPPAHVGPDDAAPAALGEAARRAQAVSLALRGPRAARVMRRLRARSPSAALALDSLLGFLSAVDTTGARALSASCCRYHDEGGNLLAPCGEDLPG